VRRETCNVSVHSVTCRLQSNVLTYPCTPINVMMLEDDTSLAHIVTTSSTTSCKVTTTDRRYMTRDPDKPTQRQNPHTTEPTATKTHFRRKRHRAIVSPFRVIFFVSFSLILQHLIAIKHRFDHNLVYIP